MELKTAFGEALRDIRVSQKLTQEDFSGVSSRTYLSSLERGIYSPTLEKLDALARVLGVHPVTLLAHCYLKADPNLAPANFLEKVRGELEAVSRQAG
ncbi:helix-turn-helix domain-containing protein [Geopseudomonas sagittaria]|uniref:helix-turn-helix domain-containing protein n=1 Tax=Geopseudomonas sagittaria TaxID=1135990 RepID=UPI000B88AEF3|nr:helix-turn-helix transcriptional regulator [Pseudomonas sagittaria]